MQNRGAELLQTSLLTRVSRRGDRPRMRCAFTDLSSTQYGTNASDCRKSSKLKVQIVCLQCSPGKETPRCTCCLTKFARTIGPRLHELEKQTRGKAVMENAMVALLTDGFDELARTGEPGKLDPFIVQRDGTCYWRDGCCPCCYSFEVPKFDARTPAAFASKKPRAQTDIVDLETPQLDGATGLIKPTLAPARVEVVRMKPVITHEESKGVRYRAADPPEHDKYRCYWKPPPAHPDGCALSSVLPYPSPCAPDPTPTRTLPSPGASGGGSSWPNRTTRLRRNRRASRLSGSAPSPTCRDRPTPALPSSRPFGVVHLSTLEAERRRRGRCDLGRCRHRLSA